MGGRAGNRRLEILQTLAAMLQQPKGEKITTAALAGRLEVSEAALYRHFASKAQMYEGLIEFIESSLFSTINRIAADETSGLRQTELIVALLLGFADKNPGLTRVLVGDVLVNEDDRLQARINQLLDRVEASLRQALRLAASGTELDGAADVATLANLLLAYAQGRWLQFVKSGFSRSPTAQWPAQWPRLQAACLIQTTPASQLQQ
ncbi:MAG: nucleoid occlusion factor SlmA [Betaproteobacteria bacterium]|nr:nucleoid occlusion factor SlmA [Betaproteobacteria bacterium]